MPQDTKMMLQQMPRVPLKWYQRIIVNSNKKLVKSSAERIISIDWCKGFAIFWITYDHLGWAWLVPELYWWGRMLFLFLYFFGPVTFLFFGGLNTTMSYRAARAKKIPPGLILYETFRRMMGLYAIAFVSRLIVLLSGLGTMTPLELFFQWDILQVIAFSVILVVPLLKYSVRTRLIIAAAILALSHPFYQFLAQFQTGSILAQFLMVIMYAPYIVDPLPTAGGIGSPLFPMFAFTIIGSIIIDLMLPVINTKKGEATQPPVIISQNTTGNDRSPLFIYKVALGTSLALILSSVIFGWGPNIDPLYMEEAAQFLDQLHLTPIFQGVAYIPQFLLEQHPWNILFKVGEVCCFFLFALYFFDLRKRASYTPSWWTRKISFFGQYSLSFFTYGFLFAPLPLHLDMWGFGIGSVIALIILTYLFQYYLRKIHGGGLVEFVMVTFGLIWRIPPSLKDVEAVYPEKVTQYRQAHPELK